MRTNFFKTLLVAVLLLMNCGNLYSNPTNKPLLRITQSDNRTLSFYLVGDERLSWGETLDGYTVLTNSNGVYCYAVTDRAGDLVASSFVACDSSERTQQETEFLSSIAKNLSFSDRQIAQSIEKFGKPFLSYPTKGNNPLLVILVEFKDRSFSLTQGEFQNLLSEAGYSENGATGSVKDYYYDNSFGQLNLNPVVVGPVTLSQNMAYYGATGTSFSDCNPKAMISEACALVDSIIDFHDFDVNNDSIIDAVHVIFAGQGESTSGETDAIWPHRWSIYDNDTVQKYFDGIRLKDYSCSAEQNKSGKMDGIGTICHEFGHVLGLPDYYDADYGKSGGNATALASWSIMASGSYNNNSNTPPIFNTNERMRVKWMQPDTLSLQGNYDIYPLIDSNRAYILTTNDSDDYYLIENRSKVGWDGYLPNKGLLIYHIKDDKKDCINCDPEFQRCDIVEADNDDSPNTLANDVFTAEGVNHFFTSYDEPYCFQWSDHSRIDKPITRIYMDTAGVVHFRFLIPDTVAIVKTLAKNDKQSSNSYTIYGLSVYDGINQSPVKGFIVGHDYDLTSAVFYPATTTQTDTFSVTLSGLDYSSKYFYKAIAVCNATDTITDDNVQSFMTSSGQPTLNIKSSDVTLNSFTLTSKKMIEGDFPVTEYGIIYDTFDNTATQNKISYQGNFSSFTETLNNLEQGTKYYCRAYAVTQIGTCYSNFITVTTDYIPIEGNDIGVNPPSTCSGELTYSIQTEDVSGGAGDFIFVWQQSSDGIVWENAQGVNNNKDYEISSITTSTYFRRLVRSHNLINISNVIFAQVNQSVGGKITGDYYIKQGDTVSFLLHDYRGTVLGWEKTNVYQEETTEDNWQPIENSANKDSLTAVFEETGNYYIRAMLQDAQCPMVYSDSFEVSVSLFISLNEIKTGQQFSITPNPATTYIILQSEDIMHQYTITDIEGRVVMQQNNVNAISVNIDISSLENGNYTVNIDGNKPKMFIVTK